VQPARILLVCSDPTGLASLAGALSERYAVLAAGTPETALELVARHGPCGAAFCEVLTPPDAGRDFVEDLSRASPGIAVIALTRSPCPDAIMRALAEDRIAGICLLPLSAESLREKARHALARSRQQRNPGETAFGILTREEVDFLLGRFEPASVQSSHRPH